MYCLSVLLVLCLFCLNTHVDSALVVKKSSKINDNYCDFANGSDENATSACSHMKVMFQCKTSYNWSVSSIPTSRVNDGKLYFLVVIQPIKLTLNTIICSSRCMRLL